MEKILTDQDVMAKLCEALFTFMSANSLSKDEWLTVTLRVKLEANGTFHLNRVQVRPEEE